jgi:hypothetical protein
LLRQGRELLETAALTIKVPDPEDYFAFDDMDTDQMLQVYEREDELFMTAKSILPAKPDRAAIRDYLIYVRRRFLEAHDV